MREKYYEIKKGNPNNKGFHILDEFLTSYSTVAIVGINSRTVIEIIDPFTKKDMDRVWQMDLDTCFKKWLRNDTWEPISKEERKVLHEYLMEDVPPLDYNIKFVLNNEKKAIKKFKKKFGYGLEKLLIIYVKD